MAQFASPAARSSRKTPEWVMLFYGFLIMLALTALYGFFHKRAYALARKAQRFSDQLAEATAPQPQLVPVRARTNARQ